MINDFNPRPIASCFNSNSCESCSCCCGERISDEEFREIMIAEHGISSVERVERENRELEEFWNSMNNIPKEQQFIIAALIFASMGNQGSIDQKLYEEV